MSVTGVATNPIFLIFILLFEKFQIPRKFNRQIPKKTASSFCLPNRAVLNRFRWPLLCYFEYCLELGFWILGFAEYCFGFGSWAFGLAVVAWLAAASTFCAASARSSAAITARPDSAINFFPASTFVPSSLTTSGTA